MVNKDSIKTFQFSQTYKLEKKNKYLFVERGSKFWCTSIVYVCTEFFNKVKSKKSRKNYVTEVIFIDIKINAGWWTTNRDIKYQSLINRICSI